MTDRLSRERRSRLMSRIRSRGTGIERDFQREHPGAVPHPDFLPYHPDFLLGGEVVFLDSAFWHGFAPRKAYDGMDGFWRAKLFKNILRDAIASSFYEACGVLVRIMKS